MSAATQPQRLVCCFWGGGIGSDRRHTVSCDSEQMERKYVAGSPVFPAQVPPSRENGQEVRVAQQRAYAESHKERGISEERESFNLFACRMVRKQTIWKKKAQLALCLQPGGSWARVSACLV